MKTIPYLNLVSQYCLIKNEILKNITKIYDTYSFVSGKLVEELEEKLAEYNGAKYCVCVNNGTSALDLAIKTFDSYMFTEVRTQANSFFATYEALDYNDYGVNFYDVNDTCGINLNNRKYNDDFIVPVSLYGNPPALTEKIKDSNEILVDNAQGIGCKINGKNLIDFCDAMTLSFYPGKNLGSNGEAGAILLNGKDSYNWLKQIRNHGQKTKGTHDLIGYNYRMSEINAAHLLVCLKYLDEWTERRIQIAQRYTENFLGLDAIKLMRVLDNNRCVYHVFPVFVRNRDKIRAKLLKLGIETAIHYPIPIHKQKCLQSAYRDVNLTNTEWQAAHELSLPIYPSLSFDNVDKISESLIKCL